MSMKEEPALAEPTLVKRVQAGVDRWILKVVTLIVHRPVAFLSTVVVVLLLMTGTSALVVLLGDDPLISDNGQSGGDGLM
jgi:uncharacterized membrane protein YdfJ with MMPL/SSD domain